MHPPSRKGDCMAYATTARTNHGPAPCCGVADAPRRQGLSGGAPWWDVRRAKWIPVLRGCRPARFERLGNLVADAVRRAPQRAHFAVAQRQRPVARVL